MYDYQLARKNGTIVFRGDAEALLNYLTALD